MDGLSALSIAASVVQFISFSCTLISKSKETYKSGQGAPARQLETEKAVSRLVELTEKLETSLHIKTNSRKPKAGDSKDGKALQAICTGCVELSEELIRRLENLRVKDEGKHRAWRSFRQALKSVWQKADIDEAVNRLDGYRRELDSHILMSLR